MFEILHTNWMVETIFCVLLFLFCFFEKSIELQRDLFNILVTFWSLKKKLYKKSFLN